MSVPIVYDRIKETSTTTGTGNISLAGAVSGFRAFSVIGNGNLTYYTIENLATGEWEVGLGTYNTTGNSLSRTTILKSSNSNNAVNFAAGTKTVFATIPAEQLQVVDPAITEGRLTLTTGTPVDVTNVTTSSSIYFTPYNGSRIALYSGSNERWKLYDFSEVSIVLSSLTSGLPYDVFIYDNAGTLTLEVVAWSTATARATNLSLQDNVYSKSGEENKKYLGTFYTISTSATADCDKQRFLWNYYNRVRRTLLAFDTTDTWTYTTATWREANGGSTVGTSRCDYVAGLSLDPIEVTTIHSQTGTGTVSAATGIGIDSSSTDSSQIRGAAFTTSAAANLTAQYKGFPGIGYHSVRWLEISGAAGTTTWFGDRNGVFFQSGLTGIVWG